MNPDTPGQIINMAVKHYIIVYCIIMIAKVLFIPNSNTKTHPLL